MDSQPFLAVGSSSFAGTEEASVVWASDAAVEASISARIAGVVAVAATSGALDSKLNRL